MYCGTLLPPAGRNSVSGDSQRCSPLSGDKIMHCVHCVRLSLANAISWWCHYAPHPCQFGPDLIYHQSNLFYLLHFFSLIANTALSLASSPPTPSTTFAGCFPWCRLNFFFFKYVFICLLYHQFLHSLRWCSIVCTTGTFEHTWVYFIRKKCNFFFYLIAFFVYTLSTYCIVLNGVSLSVDLSGVYCIFPIFWANEWLNSTGCHIIWSNRFSRFHCGGLNTRKKTCITFI